jgi:hypothetical protein
MSNEGVKDSFIITFRVDSVNEEYWADYPISWYGAPHTNLSDRVMVYPGTRVA